MQPLWPRNGSLASPGSRPGCVNSCVCGFENNRADEKGELAAAPRAGFSFVAAISHAGRSRAGPVQARSMRSNSLIHIHISPSGGAFSGHLCHCLWGHVTTPRGPSECSPGIPHGAASWNIVGAPSINPDIDTAFTAVICAARRSAAAGPNRRARPRQDLIYRKWPKLTRGQCVRQAVQGLVGARVGALLPARFRRWPMTARSNVFQEEPEPRRPAQQGTRTQGGARKGHRP